MRASSFLFSFAVSLLTFTTVSAEKPFDFASTPGKLPKNVVPEEYAIRIAPDLEKKTFTGSETIKLKSREAAKQLVLNAAEIVITKATIDGKTILPSAIKIDETAETLTIASELAEGDHQLALEFTGKINQRGIGLYYATYQEQGTG